MTKFTYLAGSACMLVMASQSAFAQTPAPQDDGGDEIVVTARLREETLQTVPLAISAVTAKGIERQGIIDMTSLASATAGLQIDSTGGKNMTSPVIRGLSQASRIDDENNTPVFIDGVYVSGRDGIDGSLLDVERIEVVKGPQSALYGRNSYAGSINYITRKPTQDFAGSASATYGDHGRRTIKGSVSGPVIDNLLFARVAAAHDEWDGSYGDYSGLRIGGYKSNFLSGGLRLASGDFEANANVYYADDLVGPSAQIMFAGNCQTISGKFGAFCGAYPTFNNPDFSGYDTRAKGLDRQTLRSSLTMTQQLGGVKLTSVTGYNRMRTKSLVDWERQYAGLPYSYRLPDGTTGTAFLTSLLTGSNFKNYDVSQEFRVESSNDSPFQWIAGGSYYGFESKIDSPYAIDSTPVPAGATVTQLGAIVFGGLRPIGASADPDDFTSRFSKGVKKTKTFAGFGAVQYTLGDKLTGRAELRYTSEEKTLTQILPSKAPISKTFGYWTPRFTVDYQASSDLLIYVSAARGAKSGGFNAAAPTAAELSFGPEFNWTYELGVKSSLFDRKLQANLSVFNVDMSGIQITNASVTAPATFITQNAGTGRSRGFEIELLARPVKGLTLQGAYSLADAKFVKAADGSLRSYPGFLVNYDVSGNALPRQAKHLVNGSVQYEAPINDGVSAYVRFDYRYESRKNGFSTPVLGYVKGRSVVNAKTGLTAGPVEASFWVRNLLNDKSPILASNTLTVNDLGRLPVALLPEFRTVGVTLGYSF